MRSAELVLYLRDGCGLCDEMLEGVRQLQAELGFALDVVEISDSPNLEARFGTKVPVLTSSKDELCSYFLDANRVRRYFAVR